MKVSHADTSVTVMTSLLVMIFAQMQVLMLRDADKGAQGAQGGKAHAA